jgi:prepilin-type N-terminal cleavage/methylation domain-containing protein/prepilin-type processing-associated H-X9-DG protein
MNTSARDRVRDEMCSWSPLLPPPQRRGGRRPAFTLVELLVVIGIIALLVGILLPTLNGARRAASVVQCSSNMKQVAMAMLMYIQDNKGRMPPTTYPSGTAVWPGGFWWPNELVRQNYVKTKNISVYKAPGATVKAFNRNNPFRCPEGLDEDSGITGGISDADVYPTHPANNAFVIFNDGAGQAEGFAVPSWYQLNSRTTADTNRYPIGDASGTKRFTPFVSFLSGGQPPDLANRYFQRTLSQVRRSAELLMIVEAANNNWYDQTESTGYAKNFLRRLGARHGKRTPNSPKQWPGGNAKTNMAFFDGHVAMYESKIFQNPQNVMDKQVKEVIFYINKQKGFR